MSIAPNLVRNLRDNGRNRDVQGAIGKLQSKFGIDLNMLMLTRPNTSNQELWLLIQRTPAPPMLRAYGQESGRADQRASDIRSIMYDIDMQYPAQAIAPNIHTGMREIGYLDVGSNTGEIAYAVAKAMNIDTANVFGLDEGEFSGMNIEKSAPINHITYAPGGQIPLYDGSMDMITILQTLHHIGDLDGFMAELKRVTRVGGVVIIREHDMDSPGFKHAIDLEHLIWSAKEEKPNNTYANFISSYYGRYFSMREMENIFKRYGFEPLPLPRRYSQLFGTTRYYYAAFMKKKA